MNSNCFKKIICLLVVFSGLSSHVLANEHVIVVKGGTFNLSDTRQTINVFPSSVNAVFEEDGGSFGVEYDYVFNSNVSIGGGIQFFSLSYNSTAGRGDMDVTFATFNSKYYFTRNDFKPFIGGTAGVAVTDFTGAVSGSSSGLALGVMAGFRYQFSVVGLYVEYKNYLSADTEDSADAKVDVSGDGIYAGISVSF